MDLLNTVHVAFIVLAVLPAVMSHVERNDGSSHLPNFLGRWARAQITLLLDKICAQLRLITIEMILWLERSKLFPITTVCKPRIRQSNLLISSITRRKG